MAKVYVVSTLLEDESKKWDTVKKVCAVFYDVRKAEEYIYDRVKKDHIKAQRLIDHGDESVKCFNESIPHYGMVRHKVRSYSEVGLLTSYEYETCDVIE